MRHPRQAAGGIGPHAADVGATGFYTRGRRHFAGDFSSESSRYRRISDPARRWGGSLTAPAAGYSVQREKSSGNPVCGPA